MDQMVISGDKEQPVKRRKIKGSNRTRKVQCGVKRSRFCAQSGREEWFSKLIPKLYFRREERKSRVDGVGRSRMVGTNAVGSKKPLNTRKR
jgi:hypothetical protein